MGFTDDIKMHLSEYKEECYPDIGNGTYRGKEYPHIFPKKDIMLNILEKYRESFFGSKHAGIKLHRYFHHLNSSQAMCINFFYPLIKEEKLHIILELLKIKDKSVDYNSVCFEKESDIDQCGNHIPTSFDFFFKTKSDKKFYFDTAVLNNSGMDIGRI